MKSKLHRVRVTQAELNYHGSITIDMDLMEAADIVENERVDVLDITNGARLTTYAIIGERGSGEICINGAAARLVNPDDLVIIISYAQMTEDEVKRHEPRIVFVDENNSITDQAHSIS
jgi:aspartate 1-decarboxylase